MGLGPVQSPTSPGCGRKTAPYPGQPKECRGNTPLEAFRDTPASEPNAETRSGPAPISESQTGCQFGSPSDPWSFLVGEAFLFVVQRHALVGSGPDLFYFPEPTCNNDPFGSNLLNHAWNAFSNSAGG